MPLSIEVAKLRLMAVCWTAGLLQFLLHAGQLAALEAFEAAPGSRFVLEVARRWGKTFLLMCIAIMTCMRRPGVRVVYGAPTLKALQEFVLPTFRIIVASCPESIRPKYNSNSHHIDFHNGSHIHLFGADDMEAADRGRGPDAVLAIFDEAGFCRVLRYVVTEIFRPSLMHSGGRTLIASTPAREPDHDFTQIAELAETNGAYFHATIDDNPRLTAEQKAKFIEDDAKDEGLPVEAYMRTDKYRREYGAERVVERSLVVLPEWADKRSKLLTAVERPEFFRGMSTLDFGGADPHGLHLGYWHHPLRAYVIEHEDLMLSPCNTLELQKRAKALESTAWGIKAWDGTMAAARDAEFQSFRDSIPSWMAGIIEHRIEGDGQPWMRVCDNDIQLTRDLYELHHLAFVPTAKDDKHLQVNNLQVAINRDEVYVHPRCVHTDRHFRTTTWADHKRKTYARRGGEHGEFVDTAVYALRNIDKRDPTPEEAGPRAKNPTVGASVRELQQRQERASGLSRAFLGSTPLGRRLMKGMR